MYNHRQLLILSSQMLIFSKSGNDGKKIFGVNYIETEENTLLDEENLDNILENVSELGLDKIYLS